MSVPKRSAARPGPSTVQGWRLFALCVLAFVVPLQCGAGLMRLAAGPLHVHAAAALAPSSQPVLEDFRRGSPCASCSEATAPFAGALSALVHGHSHPQRHHHRAGAGGTVIDGEGALERADASEDGAGSGAFAALLPIAAAVVAWAAFDGGQRLPRSSPWAVSMRFASPLERPPRRPAG